MQFKDILYLGTNEDTPVEARRTVVFSNVVYLVVGGLLLLFNIIRFNNLLHPGARIIETYTPLTIVLVSVGCLAFNHARLYLFAKVLFVVTWLSLIVVLP